MKKIFYACLVMASVCIAGCMDTTQDITLNPDGSGSLMNKVDMSNLISMAKQMGQTKDMDKIPKMDSSMTFAQLADSIKELSPADRDLIRNGTLNALINMDDEKFVITFNFPFKNIEDGKKIRNLIPVITQSAMKGIFDKMGPEGMPSGGGAEQPKMKTIEDFFDFNMTDHLVTNTFNKARYDAVADDPMMATMKQMSGMGAPITSNVIIKLPRPAIKAEGKGVKLSDDKKTVTVKASSEDFFDSPEKYEFRIEY